MGHGSLGCSSADAKVELGAQNILGYVDQQYSGLCRPPIKYPQLSKNPLKWEILLIIDVSFVLLMVM